MSNAYAVLDRRMLRFSLRFATAATVVFLAGIASGVAIHDFSPFHEAWRVLHSVSANGWSALTNLILAVLTFLAVLYAVRGVRIAEHALRADTTPVLMADTQDNGDETSEYRIGRVAVQLSWSGVYIHLDDENPERVLLTVRLTNVGKGLAEIQNIAVTSLDEGRSAKVRFNPAHAAFILASGDSRRIRIAADDPESGHWLVDAVKENHPLRVNIRFTDAAGGQAMTNHIVLEPLDIAPIGAGENYRVLGQRLARP